MIETENGLFQEVVTAALTAMTGAATFFYKKIDKASQEAKEAKVATEYLKEDVQEVKTMVRDIHNHILSKH